MLHKGYVRGSADNKDHRQLFRDYAFTGKAELAISYDSAEDATLACQLYESAGIMIPSNEGFTHVLSGFRIEERASGKFVVYCVGPFVPSVLKPGRGRV
jgi:hypothetical protein